MNDKQPKELHFTIPYEWSVRKNKTGKTHKEIYYRGLDSFEDDKKKRLD